MLSRHLPLARVLRRSLLVACACAFALACVLTSTLARAAPDLTLDPSTVTRDSPARPGNPAASIDADDCEKDVRYVFPLALTGLPASSNPLQAWAGAGGIDCSLAASRTGSAPTCWPLLSGDIDTSTSTPVVHVSTRQIVAQLGATAKTAFKDAANDDTMCHDTSLPAGPSAVSVWFLFTDASGAPVGTPAKFPMTVDVRGPAPPTGVKARVSNGALIVDFTPSKDTDTAGYTIFCDPLPSGGTPPKAIPPGDAGDGGSARDASGDDAASAAGDAASSGDAGATTCPQIPLAAGDASAAASYACGHVDGTSASGMTDPLTNGVGYAVAVAAVDRYGNVGVASASSCETPQETIDFWGNYRDGGGLAGGGFCAVRRVGSSPGKAPFALAGAMLAIALFRRRRRTSLQGGLEARPQPRRFARPMVARAKPGQEC